MAPNLAASQRELIRHMIIDAGLIKMIKFLNTSVTFDLKGRSGYKNDDKIFSNLEQP